MVLRVLLSPPMFGTCYYPASPSAPSGSPPDSIYASTCTYFKSNTSCYQHCSDNQIPRLCTASSKRPIIGRVAIYCAAILYLLRTYTSTPSKRLHNCLLQEGVLPTSVLNPSWLPSCYTEGHPVTETPRDRPMGGGSPPTSTTPIEQLSKQPP